MRIGIVGGGPSSVSIVIGLSQFPANTIRNITIFDKAGVLNSDFLVSSEFAFLTNTSSGITSIVPGAEGDFVHWLKSRHRGKASPGSFVPRRIYRRYAIERFSAACARLNRNGCDCRVLTSVVSGVRKLASGSLEILTQAGTSEFDIVIVASGAAQNNPCPELSHDSRYIGNIYKEKGWQERVPKGGAVLLLGSKLSAVDAASLLRQSRPDVHITMASRSGKLPSVRNELIRYELKNLNTKRHQLPADHGRLRAVFTLAARDLRELAEGSELPRYADNAKDQLQADIQACEAGQNRWQFAIGHFIEEMNRIWPLLSEDEQRRFKARYSHFISRYVSSFPLENAVILNNMLGDGKLDLVATAGAWPLVEAAAGGLVGLGPLAGRRFDLVANCTGLEIASQRKSALGAALEHLGCSYNPHGGLSADTSTMRLLPPETGARLYGIGAPISGSLLVTNYVRASVQQAEIIIADIAAEAGRSVQRGEK